MSGNCGGADRSQRFVRGNRGPMWVIGWGGVRPAGGHRRGGGDRRTPGRWWRPRAWEAVRTGCVKPLPRTAFLLGYRAGSDSGREVVHPVRSPAGDCVPILGGHPVRGEGLPRNRDTRSVECGNRPPARAVAAARRLDGGRRGRPWRPGGVAEPRGGPGYRRLDGRCGPDPGMPWEGWCGGCPLESSVMLRQKSR